MTTSGVTSFSSSAAEFIADALNLLGVLAEEEPLPAYDLQRGLRFLTRMFKQWEGLGVGSWLRTEGTFTLTAPTGAVGVTGYVFGSGGTFTTIPFDITDARITRGGTDLPLSRLSREEYYALPLKTITGYPTQFFYDRQLTTGTFYVWPTSDAGLGTIGFTYRRRIMDMISGPDNADIPPEWEKAIVENLAYDLASVYGKAGSDEFNKIARDAPISFAIIQGFDVGESEGSITITPDDGYGWSRY